MASLTPKPLIDHSQRQAPVRSKLSSTVIDTKMLSKISVVEPTNDTPWSVDVTSAIPKDIMSRINNNKFITGCNIGRWYCAVVDTNNSSDIHDSNVTPYQLFIWYASPNQTLKNQKFKAPYHILSHGNELNQKKIEKDCIPLVSMTIAENPYITSNTGTTALNCNDSAVYVYAANPTSGVIMLWKVSLYDLQQQSQNRTKLDAINTPDVHPFKEHPYGYKCSIHRNNSIDDRNDENFRLTSLDVSWIRPSTINTSLSKMKGSPCVVVGSSHGHVYCITQTHVPMSLQVQDVSIIEATDDSDNFGILTRLFTTPSKKKTRRILTENSNTCSVVRVQIVDRNAFQVQGSNQNQEAYFFVSTSISGQVILWKVKPTESSHHAIIEVCVSTDISCNTISTYFEKYGINDSIVSHPLSSFTVKNVSVKATEKGNGELIVLSMLVTAVTDVSDCHESRLYWIQFAITTSNKNIEILHIEWLSRFVDPVNNTRTIGLTISDNDCAYAAFSPIDGNNNSTESHVVMALVFPETRSDKATIPSLLKQLELPSQQLILPHVWSPDTVTHGISALDQTGLGIRIRLIPIENRRLEHEHSISDSYMREHQSDNPSQSQINALMNHLFAANRESYVRPDQIVRLPPVITSVIGTHILEEAVIQYCRKAMTYGSSITNNYYSVSNESDEGSSRSLAHDQTDQDIPCNPIEWHSTYIYMLQQTGIYRTLSNICKWKLMEVGQELTVFQALYHNRSSDTCNSEWHIQQLSELRCNGVAHWLSKVQSAVVLRSGAGEDQQAAWLNWLCVTVEVAMTFREDFAMSHYDVTANQTPEVESPENVPIWTSSSTIQLILIEQLNFWLCEKKNRSSAKMEQIETVVQCALQSYCDTFFSCPYSQIARQNYATCQKVAIDLIRCVKNVMDDHFAFALCQAHCYFDGLCQISFDHERRLDHEIFSLKPFFSQLASTMDIRTNEVFGEHILRWHCHRGLFGQLLNYGQECPEVLENMMQTEDVLKPFRWIYEARKGDLESAAEFSLDISRQSETLLSDTKTAVSISSLCTSFMENKLPLTSLPNSVIQRRRSIEKMRELINAQEELFGENDNAVSNMLPSDLLDGAIEKVRVSNDLEVRINACVIALAICTAFETSDKTQDGAVFVWYESIRADMNKWEEWLRTINDVTNARLRDIILQTTVFGGLLEQCKVTDGWEQIMYSSSVERALFTKLAHNLPNLFTGKLQRLLRSVAMSQTDNETSSELSNVALETKNDHMILT